MLTIKMTEEDAVAISKNIQGWMRDRELAWLFRLAQQQVQGATWVEVGSWKGRSLVSTALGLPEGCNLYSIDPHCGNAGSKVQDELGFPMDWVKAHLELAVDLIESFRTDLLVTHYPSTSLKMSDKFKDAFLDVVFVDGEHTEKAVTQDIGLWWPKVKPGGILAGHDISHPGVKAALRASLPGFKEGAGSIWYIRKETA